MGRTRDQVIGDIELALADAGYSMRAASIKLGLNQGYLSEFMRKTDYSPEVLPEDVRLALATLLGVDEKIFRIGKIPENFANAPEGIKAYDKRAAGDGRRRRTTEMRVDELLQEIGRIKERLDRLEAQPEEKSGGKKARPQ